MKRSIACLLFFGLLVTAIAGCRAGDETKRGTVGEFCNNRDDDCRAGLICEEGLCVDEAPATEFTCADGCQRLDECGASQENCTSKCRVTVEGWALRAVDSFTRCLAEGLSCSEAQAGDPPNICYNRIEIPEGRTERCDSFTNAVRSCASGEASDFRKDCYGYARVRSAEDWSGTSRCVDALSAGVCSGLETCLREELELDSLELGDGNF